ncbi:hypothetical protein RHMOL_Rhmol07G0159100 [Rhododendron molle]|uniref:Uncharacterized protein n=1 Tax=Rhododendron molle TaxID=49168 RepID=A0ACC0N2J2_RHOML|nr:hypothetical protein RHMOL_Rhmol07G0159100 [Rhododendron molle]
MDSKWVEVLDNGCRRVDDSNRRRAAKCAANITRASRKVFSLSPKHNSLLSKLGKRKRLGACKTTCGQSLVQNYSNYLRSGLPQRLLFYQDGEWIDFPEAIVALVKKDFQMKKAAIEVQFNGCHIILDVLYMLQVDLKTGSQKPIAWIDEAGQCFFPRSYSSGSKTYECDQSDLDKDGKFVYPEPNGTREIKLHLHIELSGANGSNLEECVEESNTRVKRVRINEKLGENRDELNVNDNCNGKSDAKMEESVKEVQQIGAHFFPRFEGDFEAVNSDIVRNMFIKGMDPSLRPEILEINQCNSNILQTRREIFLKQAEITCKYRGDPNIHASYCDVDENGVRHVVLCRVILGKVELVRHGSEQFHPSCENFDSGVDDLENPNHYIVWNMNVGTHIYPEYVVSFKISHSAEGAVIGKESRFDIPGVTSCQEHHHLQLQLDSASVVSESHPCQDFVNNFEGKAPSVGSTTSKTPKSPWMPLVMLFGAISNKIDPKDMKMVYDHYDSFRLPSNLVCQSKVPKEEQEG